MPAAIGAALKKIKEMVSTGAITKTTPIHITLEAGTYRETIKYNLTNPLVIEGSASTKNTSCIIQADNCESFHKGIDNRAVFALGPLVTNVKLKNLSIINTHSKSTPNFSAQDAAEALVWNNTTGTLLAEGVQLVGRQNTLYLKGFSWFKDCYIAGEVDFIYGEVDTAFFEETEINVRDSASSNPTTETPAYAIKSQALASKRGFVFFNCRFTGEKRKKYPVYLCRTEGKGSATSTKGWDSIALLNCFISDSYEEELVYDNDMELNTHIVSKDRQVTEADTTRRNIKTYSMTDDDYFLHYASRFLILKDTPFAQID